jgi:hypothetical protein
MASRTIINKLFRKLIWVSFRGSSLATQTTTGDRRDVISNVWNGIKDEWGVLGCVRAMSLGHV